MNKFEECVAILIEKGIPESEAIEIAKVAFTSTDRSQETVATESYNFQLVSEESEERYVLGPVLIPNHLDLNGTMFPERIVRKTAHDFMTKYQTNKFMHMLGLREEDVNIVESYILQSDSTINGVDYKKGTWMMGIIVHNNTIWNYIKEGKIRGFSIGGRAHPNSLIRVAKLEDK